jgi:hypothetical protein
MVRLTLAIALLALTGCGLPAFGQGQGCSTVQIDWVDFIQVGSTQYVAGSGNHATLQESDLGQVVAHVKYRVDGNVCDPNYRPKDGDAAFLDPETPIYEVRGHPTSEVLAARRNGQILRYSAFAPVR